MSEVEPELVPDAKAFLDLLTKVARVDSCERKKPMRSSKLLTVEYEEEMDFDVTDCLMGSSSLGISSKSRRIGRMPVDVSEPPFRHKTNLRRCGHRGVHIDRNEGMQGKR